jgi:LacI family transcriptional regulator
MAVQRLVALGHQRIAYVHAPLAFNFAWQRRAGYLDAMHAAGIDPLPEWSAGGGLGRRAGYAAAQQLLRVKPRPTAILVDNNTGGIGLLRALLDADVAIGREVSVVVNEGIPEDTLFSDLLVAAVQQPTPYGSGQALAEMVMGLLQHRPLAELQILRQPVFVEGDSMGPPQY